MSPEQNKAIVIEIWEQMARGETTALSDAMTDDFTWVFPGVWSWAGEWGPKDVALSQMLRPLMQQFASYASRAELVLADGDKVVVQARAEATTLRGDRYRIRSPASSCACATARLPSSSSIATPRWSSASCTHPHDATDRSRPRPGRPTEISDCHEAGSIQHQHGCGRINMGAAAGPEQILAVVHAAEEAGFESVWAGEHVVLPDPQTPTSPLSPKAPVLDSVATLAWIAAHTRTLRLATGIAILPQHNPCVLAKEIATLDALSGGRAILGIGSGYLEPEFAALGANFAERGAVTDEYLDAIDHLWYDERPAYHGRFASFDGIDACPRPIQTRVPIVVGGNSPPAYRRAVTRGTGWYGYWLTPEETATSLAGLRAAADRHQRPETLGELEITVTPRTRPTRQARGSLTRQSAEAFAELGVHRLVPWPPDTPAGATDAIEQSLKATAGL